VQATLKHVQERRSLAKHVYFMALLHGGLRCSMQQTYTIYAVNDVGVCDLACNSYESMIKVQSPGAKAEIPIRQAASTNSTVNLIAMPIC
jgi:hypothetical protein